MITRLTQVWLQGPLIVGAGPSGLAVAACLSQRGIPFLILEKENCIASLWRLRSYDSLRLHLPKKLCQLPHMLFPKHYPVYPSKQQFISYLDSYAEHFSIHPMFGYDVKNANYDAVMDLWRVVANGSEYLCRWLIVATGDNAVPSVPEIDGLKVFGGKIMHSSDYKNGAGFRGRKVLVVGCGNSGMEISLNLCCNGARVSLVVRHKLHILPRDILGRSSIGIALGLLKLFPLRLIDWFLIQSSRLLLGDTSRVGIVRPQDGPLKLKNKTGKTPVLDVGLLSKIKSGQIKVVGEVQRFTSNGVEFMDGKVEEFDSVILATGYTSNVASWLKEENLSTQGQGDYSKSSWRSNMKSKNGIYSIGFTGQGIFGASTDAERAAEDIARQWNSQRKLPGSKINPSLCVA
ncbi:putative indole-3-pyruvate monooxygenase YUCCA7 [Bidens hawaiensis]|uniref:putative indole-3-pyruvate monooxygenase YUCCA7 n=1 Tax=Bidens hawaiensis TaxID=980011 RepID=UPI00404913FE